MGVLNLFIAVVLLAVALVASGAEDDFEVSSLCYRRRWCDLRAQCADCRSNFLRYDGARFADQAPTGRKRRCVQSRR